MGQYGESLLIGLVNYDDINYYLKSQTKQYSISISLSTHIQNMEMWPQVIKIVILDKSSAIYRLHKAWIFAAALIYIS